MNRNWPPPDGTVQVLAGVKLHHPQHAIALFEHIGVGRFDDLAEVVLQAYRGQALGTGDKLGTLDHATLLQLAAHTYPRLVGLIIDVEASRDAKCACAGVVSSVPSSLDVAAGSAGKRC